MPSSISLKPVCLLWSVDRGPQLTFLELLKVGTPSDIGHFYVTINAIDIAAMGGHPFGMLMVLALSGDERQSYLEGFLEGVRQAMSEYGIGLLGGDTKQTAGRSTTITIIGEAHRAGSLLRRGAEPGDKIFITPGEIGATLRSYILAARMRKRKEIAQVIRPTAKLTFGQALANDRIATSCIDMSDGLLASAEQLGQLNGVIFRIDAQNVPYATSPTSVREVEWRDLLLNVGGDFGLMFTTKRSDVRFAESMGAYCIGEVIAAQAGGLRVVERDRLGIRFRGWEQFKTTEPISSDILSFV